MVYPYSVPSINIISAIIKLSLHSFIKYISLKTCDNNKYSKFYIHCVRYQNLQEDVLGTVEGVGDPDICYNQHQHKLQICHVHDCIYYIAIYKSHAHTHCS